jgi:EAL domain-containing protein (putative c-di-GMP-specific phosphodiesterase class I)
VAFQPIWQLSDERVLGREALARPWDGYGFDGPAEAFAEAEKVGRGPELDALCRAAALARGRAAAGGRALPEREPADAGARRLSGDRWCAP